MTDYVNKRLFYFNSRKNGEIDFLLEALHGAIPIEVKSGRDYKRHKALDNLLSVKEYLLREPKVLSNSPAVELGNVSYLPIYATMFIGSKARPEEMIFRV